MKVKFICLDKPPPGPSEHRGQGRNEEHGIDGRVNFQNHDNMSVGIHIVNESSGCQVCPGLSRGALEDESFPRIDLESMEFFPRQRFVDGGVVGECFCSGSDGSSGTFWGSVWPLQC